MAAARDEDRVLRRQLGGKRLRLTDNDRRHCQLVCSVYSQLAAMSHRLCSICQVQGRLLEYTSQDAVVEYYRCDTCGHIWTLEKANPDAPPIAVTVKLEKPHQSP
jgi:hypothetical protein